MSLVITIGLCIGLAIFIFYCTMQRNDDEADYVDVRTVVKYINQLEMEKALYKEALEKVRRHIKNKTLKSFKYDIGISDDCEGRLMTETVIELQVIEDMINRMVDKVD